MFKITPEDTCIRPDLFLWPEEQNSRWLETAYPHNEWTNTRLIELLGSYLGRHFSLLDVGCGNGLFVQDVINAGHIGVGIDGCYYYRKFPGHLWKNYPTNAFIVDVSQPYTISYNGEAFTFDVITSWEHFEHLLEEQVPQAVENIANHSHVGTKLVLGIGNHPDGGHFTLREFNWWTNHFQKYGFIHDDNLKNHISRNYVRDIHDSHYLIMSKEN